ncbi:MAG: hypothetical protein AYL28_003680 [Candidatus Bathyarchaeota archaeon B23]|nr:MAG: hypothetical protein AYL28_003680 [Candidatus Bathyarchaeota archaeon B23]
MSEERRGYILRIVRDDWVERVFNERRYYSGVSRRWRRGDIILLAKGTEVGDSFLGYGVVEKAEEMWELPPEERRFASRHGWRWALTLNPLFRFERPLPVKETLLAEDPRRGRLLHGATLTEEEVDAILEAAEDYQG